MNTRPSTLPHHPRGRARAAGLLLAGALLLAGPALRADIPPADLLAAGQAALSDGLYPLAEKHLVQYLTLARQNVGDPQCRQAFIYLCRALAKQRKYADLLSILDKNADIVASGDDRPFTYWRAYAVLESGDPGQALALIDPGARLAAVTNDMVNLHLVRLAADANARLDTPDTRSRAEELLAFFLRTAPQDAPRLPDAQFLQARLLARRGARDEAFATFKNIADGGRADAGLAAGALLELVALSETNAPAARAFAGRLARLPLGKAAPDYAIPCGRLLASRAETAADGARLLAAAIRENPTSPHAPDAQLTLAEAWLSAGSNTLAAAAFKTFLETYGAPRETTSRATAGRAEALYRLGEFSEAATLFQKAADTPSDLGRSILDMRAADALHAEGKYEAAAALYYDISCRAHTMTGHDYGIQLLDYFYPDGAADGLGFILYRARFMSADSLERCGKTDEALKRFDGIASAKTTGPTILFSEEALYRAALLFERKAEAGGAEAIARYTALISATTNTPLRCRALLGRGRCHYRLKSFDIAIDDFRAAAAGATDAADEAALYQVYALYGLHKDDEAVALAESVVAQSPETPVCPTLSFWLGQYGYNRGDFKEACARFRAFATRWPGDTRAPLALLWAAEAAVRLSENQTALDLLAELVQRHPESPLVPKARYNQASCLCNLARFEDAILVLDDAIRKFPSAESTTRALILKGDALFSLHGSAAAPQGIDGALAAYALAADRSDATVETRLECNLKRARCHEKTGDDQGAIHLYADGVVYPFLQLDGEVSQESAALFERAAFAAAQLLERRKDTTQAVRILGHIVTAGTPGKPQAEREIQRLLKGDDTP